MQRRELGFGETFINTGNLLRPFDVLTVLRGCKINFIGGGNNKVFAVYEDKMRVQKIIPLHPAEIDQYDYTVSEGQDTENFTMNTTEQDTEKIDMGHIVQLKSDQNFNLFLNDKGEVFVTGQGTYGVLGLGNRRLAMTPIRVFSAKQGVKSIACGSGHCMLLTNDRSLYVWGRNFEGQLGIPYTQISCKPLFNPFFNYTKPKIDAEEQKKLYIDDIFLAGSHSFAVLNDRSLYAWGENLYGQLGLPTKSKYTEPMKVPLEFGIRTIAAAKTHTLILSETGQLYSTGLNNYGQLGLGQMSKQDRFTHIFEDFHNNPLPEFASIQTNYNSGLAVTTSGDIYVWGKAILLEEKQVQPVRVDMQKDVASLDHVYLSNLNCLVFSKLMAYDVSPKVSSSIGGTKFSMRGYGFTDFNGRQRIRFSLFFNRATSNRNLDDDQKSRLTEIENASFETSMSFNEEKNMFEFVTPLFFTEHYLGDAEAKIEISLDGESWIKTSLSIIIYNCNTRILELSPRYIHIEDSQQLKIQLSNPIDFPETYSKDIKIAFMRKNPIKKRTSRFGNEPETLPDANKLPRLLTIDGIIQDGQITCDLPKITELQDTNTISYPYTCYVSVSLDGQQLFEASVELTYYSISEATVKPRCVKFEGGVCHAIEMLNFFNSPFASIQLVYGDKITSVKPSYIRQDKVYEFHSPMLEPPVIAPISEADNNDNVEPKLIESIEVDLRMTLCGNYYQSITSLFYHIPKITNLLSQLEKDKNESVEDYRSRLLRVEDPFSVDLELPDKEADKKRKEIEKKLSVLETALKTGVAKPKDFVFIRGQNFVVGQPVDVKLTYSEDLVVIEGVVKSAELIVFEVPDLRADQTSVTEIVVDVSFNSKQYTNTGLIFDALLLRKDALEETRDKEIQEFLKKYKKPKK